MFEKRLKMRSGFTLVELIISLVVIGILLTIGYKGYTNITLNSKGKAVASDINKIKAAIATTAGQTGGYYQSSQPPACPQKVTDPGQVTLELEPGTPDNSEFAMRVENTLHSELLDKGMRLVGDTIGEQQFRLSSFPLASISFPLEINGVRAIRIRGISGAVALRVLKTLNATGTITPEDGGSLERPITIVQYNSVGGEIGSEAGAFGNCDTEGSDNPTLTSFNCIIGDTDGGNNVRFDPNDPNVLTTIENTPKVTIYYTYEFGTTWE